MCFFHLLAGYFQQKGGNFISYIAFQFFDYVNLGSAMVISKVYIMFQEVRNYFPTLYLFTVMEGGLHYCSYVREEGF